MKKTLIVAVLFAVLHSGAFAVCPGHTKLDSGSNREVIHQDFSCNDVTSVPTTSENVLIALSGMVLAFGLVALRERNGRA